MGDGAISDHRWADLDMRTLSPHDLRVLRARLRREREVIHEEAISRGATDELCRRMNDLERAEATLTRLRLQPRPARPRPVWQMLAALRRGEARH